MRPLTSISQLKPLSPEGISILEDLLASYIEPYRTLVRDYTPELSPLLPYTGDDTVLALSEQPYRILVLTFKSSSCPETFILDKDLSPLYGQSNGAITEEHLLPLLAEKGLKVKAISPQIIFPKNLLLLLVERYSKPQWAKKEGFASFRVVLNPDNLLNSNVEAEFIADVMRYIRSISPEYFKKQFGDIVEIESSIKSHVLRLLPTLLESYRQVVRPVAPAHEEIKAFQILLASQSIEEPFQIFLAQHPHFLSLIATKVYPKFQLGKEYVTDFLVIESGDIFNFIEIERPGLRLMIQKSKQASELTQALEQIRDWRNWLRENPEYFRKDFSQYRPGREKFTLIGGRLPENIAAWQRIQDSWRQSGVDILTYDEIGDRISTARSRLFDAIQQINATHL